MMKTNCGRTGMIRDGEPSSEQTKRGGGEDAMRRCGNPDRGPGGSRVLEIRLQAPGIPAG